MKKITLGKDFGNIKHDFRETCFGICIKDGKILLTYKTNKNEYSLPGGGIEINESHKQCLSRELVEETGYKLISVDEFITIDCFWMAGGVWPMESLANFYIIEVGTKNLPTEEFCQSVWVTLDEEKQLLQLPYQCKAFQLYLNNFIKKNSI
ncbi:MAG: NUDIX domain-containing protein [Clostridia bacterium]|jgi:8-oxo-dGTP diphosphatase|nr:NUDIX domain-containing protein [Clostridia bacterium]